MLVTPVVKLELVDRWICIAVAVDGAMALFVHVSETFVPFLVALRLLGAAGMPTTVRAKVWAAKPLRSWR